MSAPAFDPARGEIWYADGNSGFYNVHITNGVWPFTTAAAAAAKPAIVQAGRATAAPSPAPRGSAPAHVGPQLAVTGGSAPIGTAGAALAGGLLLLGVRRRLRTS